MKITSLLSTVAAGASLLLAACGGGEQLSDEQRAINDAAASVTAASVGRVAVEAPHALETAWDDVQRGVLDKLVPLGADSPLCAADSACSNASTIVGVIEQVADGLPEVPHVTRYKQRVGTVKVPVAGGDSVSAEWLVDLDWPDATLDESRGIRHWLNDCVFDVLNGQFAQPEGKDGGTAVKPFKQALDDPAAMMHHYAGQYSRCYKAAVEGGAADVQTLARPALIARVRAVSDSWVTYYVAAVDRTHAPRYCFVSLNRVTGAVMQAADLTDKAGADALGKAVVAALNAAGGVQDDKAPYSLAATPEGFVASRQPSTVVYF